MSITNSPWDSPPVPTPDLAGDGVTARGGDPNVTLSGTDALKPLWDGPIVPTPAGKETANSVSGLPGIPSRNQPSETPPAPPTIDERSPTTLTE